MLVDMLRSVFKRRVADAEGWIRFEGILEDSRKGGNKNWVRSEKFIPRDMIPLLPCSAPEGRMAGK